MGNAFFRSVIDRRRSFPEVTAHLFVRVAGQSSSPPWMGHDNRGAREPKRPLPVAYLVGGSARVHLCEARGGFAGRGQRVSKIRANHARSCFPPLLYPFLAGSSRRPPRRVQSRRRRRHRRREAWARAQPAQEDNHLDEPCVAPSSSPLQAVRGNTIMLRPDVSRHHPPSLVETMAPTTASLLDGVRPRARGHASRPSSHGFPQVRRPAT